MRRKNKTIEDLNPNREAFEGIENFLKIQSKKNFQSTMAEIQNKYQGIPYGWLDIDIAVLVAVLIRDKKVTIKYSGKIISAEDPKLPDMLMKKGEIGKTVIGERQSLNPAKRNKVIAFLRDYLQKQDVPKDEDGLIKFITEKFTDLKKHYEQLNEKYIEKKYPDRALVENAIKIVEDFLSQSSDLTTFIDRLIDREDALFDAKESLEKVKSFSKIRSEFLIKS